MFNFHQQYRFRALANSLTDWQSNFRFDRDLRWRTGVQLLPVECHSSNNFKVTVSALEAAYEKAQEAGIRVKGLLITNPSNPLGTILDRETLTSILSFINEKSIHLVCDEIYAATVFSSPRFVSIAEILTEVAHCNRDLVHIVYSLSKDLGLPGFRVGVVYSYNDHVVSCGRKMSSFGLVSTQTQHLIASLLSDGAFVEKFIAESERRLAERHSFFTRELARVRISCLKSNAGLFCWMDLRALLKEPTVDGEMELWRTIIDVVKLNVSPGASFHCSEPGWFRVCFAVMDDDTMRNAVKRIQEFMSEYGKAKAAVPVAKKKGWQGSTGLRLSFRNLRCEEMPMTPHMMSPHCLPSPHSPLVRAAS
ncbi:acetyl-coenzyme A synthetase 2 [Asimina triloba]